MQEETWVKSEVCVCPSGGRGRAKQTVRRLAERGRPSVDDRVRKEDRQRPNARSRTREPIRHRDASRSRPDASVAAALGFPTRAQHTTASSSADVDDVATRHSPDPPLGEQHPHSRSRASPRSASAPTSKYCPTCPPKSGRRPFCASTLSRTACPSGASRLRGPRMRAGGARGPGERLRK